MSSIHAARAYSPQQRCAIVNSTHLKFELSFFAVYSYGLLCVPCKPRPERAPNRHAGEDDAARSDLRAASALGSEFAKQQLVALNPYAALCASALSDIFARLHGSGSGTGTANGTASGTANGMREPEPETARKSG